MPWVEVLVLAAVAVVAVGLLWWLSRPLVDALGWMSDPADTMRPDADDLRAAEHELHTRP